MNPRKISVKKYNFKNSENNNEEKSISKYIFQIKNKNNNYNAFNDDKKIKFIFLKNNETPKKYQQGEDDYTPEIYNNPISKFKYFSQESENDFKYNTISNFDSLDLKNKYFLVFNQLKKNKSYNDKNNMNNMELFSDLNLSFGTERNNIKNNIFLKQKRKVIDKNKKYFDKIINIFNAKHKKIKIKYYKNNKSKLKYSNKNNKNKINYYNNNNNYNYIKNNPNSKFSKKIHCHGLRKNYSSLIDSHIKVESQNYFKEYNKRKIINPQQNTDINNKIPSTEKKENFRNIEYKNENSFKSNKNKDSIKSTNKNLFNINASPNQSTSSKSHQIKNEDEFDRSKKIKIENIYIGLNKKNITDTSYTNNINQTTTNNDIYNPNSKILFRYSNRKSKSIIADNSIKKNNNTSIKIYYKKR